MKDTANNFRAILCVIGAGCCWGMIGLFSRPLKEASVTSVQISMLRSLMTAAAVFMIITASDKKKLKIDLRDLWMFLGSGILSIAFFNVCYFISIGENTLSLAAILLYTAPSFVVLLSNVIFKEVMTSRKALALLISFAGLLCSVGLVGAELQTSTLGILAGLGSGFGYALYSIFSGIALRKYHWLTLVFYTFFFAALCLLPFSRPMEVIAYTAASPQLAINTLALGLLATLLPFALYTKGLKSLEIGTASILTFVEPVVATLVGIVVFNEVITAYNVGGILMIILSLFVLNSVGIKSVLVK